jgi:hypothetical protein
VEHQIQTKPRTASDDERISLADEIIKRHTPEMELVTDIFVKKVVNFITGSATSLSVWVHSNTTHGMSPVELKAVPSIIDLAFEVMHDPATRFDDGVIDADRLRRLQARVG